MIKVTHHHDEKNIENVPKHKDHSKNGSIYKEESKSESKSKIRRKPWQPHEDEQVIALVRKFGTKWAKIASIMKERTGKQIRDRYLNNLNPDIDDKEWTPEEDNMLLYLYYTWGKKWSKIATCLPGRSEGQVKNRFYWGLKRKMLHCNFTCHNPVRIATNQSAPARIPTYNMSADYIPKINMGQDQPKITGNVYFDYPTTAVRSQQRVAENLINTSKPEMQGPDDFISYTETPNIRIDTEAFLEKFSNNIPKSNMN